jgi:putative transposase
MRLEYQPGFYGDENVSNRIGDLIGSACRDPDRFAERLDINPVLSDYGINRCDESVNGSTSKTESLLGAEDAAALRTPESSALVTRTLRLKVRPEAYRWLEAAASEVNQVWNWCNEISAKASRPYVGKGKWLSGFDLNNLSAGATQCFERIGADTIQRVNLEYALRRRQFRKMKLRFRVSRGARRSLGWVPFKAASLKRKGKAVRFCGKAFRLFEAERLADVRWQQGCFAQDAVGDWWLCLPVEHAVARSRASHEAVGIDLGLKAIATTSDGETLDAGRWTKRYAVRLATAQRRGHKRQAKRVHRRIARCRADALHKFSRKIIDHYQTIIVGDMSSLQLAKTRMAKSVLDAGWGRLRQMLQYKGEHAGRSVQIIQERFTTRACSSCDRLTGPSGPRGLVVRRWCCAACGAAHDRDVNAARNILARSRCRTAVGGNESSSSWVRPSSAPRATRTEPASSAA